jgi:hypothetical protein
MGDQIEDLSEEDERLLDEIHQRPELQNAPTLSLEKLSRPPRWHFLDCI